MKLRWNVSFSSRTLSYLIDNPPPPISSNENESVFVIVLFFFFKIIYSIWSSQSVFDIFSISLSDGKGVPF